MLYKYVLNRNLHPNLAIITPGSKHALVSGVPGYSVEAFLAGAVEGLNEFAILFVPNVDFAI